MMPAHSIPVARYRLSAQLQDDIVLPDYAGSLLRGQFGAALRNLSCTTQKPSCGGCPALITCTYSQLFEAPAPATYGLQKFSHIPAAYVIEPPSMQESTQRCAGEHLQFGMVLAGAARDQLPLLLLAWQRALAEGLTRSRSRAELLQVEWLDADKQAHSVWQRKLSQSLVDHPAVLNLPTAASELESITLQIHTPMRLQHQGQPLFAHNLSPRTLVAALARRIALVLDFHAQQPGWGKAVPQLARLAETLHDQRELYWHDWQRYSSRQEQEMPLGGVVGRWTLYADSGTLAILWPWLWLGQWLHVGKNATMGMGAYTLTVSDRATVA